MHSDSNIVSSSRYRTLSNLLLMIMLTSACGETKFSRNDNSVQLPTADVKPKKSDCIEDPSAKECLTTELKKEVLATMPVVFAVREPSCLSCHLKVKGDFVTDFMAGSKVFAGAIDYELGFATPDQKNHRFSGPHAFRTDMWPNLNLDGRYIIPKFPIDDSAFAAMLNPLTPPTSLLAALTTSITMVTTTATGEVNPASLKAIPLPVVGKTRDKTLAGVNELLEVEKIEIKPPTAKIMSGIFKEHAKIKLLDAGNAYLAVTAASQKVTGFKVVTGISGEKYIEASGDIRCSGDVLIRGAFVLQDVRILGDDCRFYIDGTTFLQGSIAFDNATATVQFASSYPIYAGLKQVERRFSMTNYQNYHDRNVVVAQAANVFDHLKEAGAWWVAFDAVGGYDAPMAYNYTEKENASGGPTLNLNNGQWTALNGKVLTSFTACSFNGSPDDNVNWPRKPTGGANCGIARNGHHDFRSINFERILVVTSEFQSRFHGTFKGALVAQSAGFSKGVASYEFDARLRATKVLPLYPEPYLVIKK